MTNPCEMGYDCPHKGVVGEDFLCLYPHTRYDQMNREILQTFSIIECVDCPLEEDWDA